jgi:hypothetical protein
MSIFCLRQGAIRGRAIAPDTFIRGSDPKAHPHFYCDLAGLAVRVAGNQHDGRSVAPPRNVAGMAGHGGLGNVEPIQSAKQLR